MCVIWQLLEFQVPFCNLVRIKLCQTIDCKIYAVFKKKKKVKLSYSNLPEQKRKKFYFVLWYHCSRCILKFKKKKKSKY